MSKSKRIEIAGIYYRVRRGRLVPIPEEWVGKTVHDQTLRERKQDRIMKRWYLKRRLRLIGPSEMDYNDN